MFTNKRVLLLDWGIGGLSVYQEVQRRNPGLACVYVSDSGFTPYGKAPAAELADRLEWVITTATRRFEIATVLIACNAASTALQALRPRLPELFLEGMIEAGVETLAATGEARVGFIGGIRTVESGAYQAALAARGITGQGEAAQPLSALIEAGELAGERLHSELARILAPLRGIPALLLACTHYPAIAGEIQKHLPGTRLLDPAPRAAAKLPFPAGKVPGSKTLFFTTGDAEASTRSAQLAFNIDAPFRRAEWLA